MNISRMLTIVATLALAAAPASAVVDIPVDLDFFASGWVFGAPWVRDAGRASLGVSTTDPFLQGFGEETTYFTFNFDPGAFSGPVDRAILEVETVIRAQGSYPNAAEPFAISAHRLTGDPTTIDPMLASGPGSYRDFLANHLGPVEDTVALTGAGIFQWDVTALVNEWIASGEANFEYAIAMTGRVGNPADTEDSGAFHAFVNKGVGTGLAAHIIVVPEPGTLLVLAAGATLAMRRRGSNVTQEG